MPYRLSSRAEQDLDEVWLHVAEDASPTTADRLIDDLVNRFVAPHEGNTYRAVYTVKFTDAIYVLHAFQKKSKSGIATPKSEIDLIRRRLADAERLHAERRK